MNVAPTIDLRPGYPFNVLVTQDVGLSDAGDVAAGIDRDAGRALDAVGAGHGLRRGDDAKVSGARPR